MRLGDELDSSALTLMQVEDDDIRDLAGRCFLAMATGDGRILPPFPAAATLARSGLAGTHATLCTRLGVLTSRDNVAEGMRLSAINDRRWVSLLALLDSLAHEGLEPILFKGGVLHARWPQMRGLRDMFDYDLIVPQHDVDALRSLLSRQGFESAPAGSRFTQRLCKGWMVWKGEGLDYLNLDVHARVTEPPVCASLTSSILATSERAAGVRVPDVEDCICMIALHIVRSGMYRPLREYIDLLWYIDPMTDAQWTSVVARASRHHLAPALYLSLRQAIFCLRLDRLDPDRADTFTRRMRILDQSLGALRMWALDRLAPPDYPLHPVESRNHPLFRRSIILGAGTGSTARVCAAFLAYGTARILDAASASQSSTGAQA